ncbi:viperin family antiviral radical SAM protein [Treponema primitia]|uniref:viperin family antiviral radical SAM protein n=1 Tax=Treponema primitia TaxID=88058 RepID=UPI0002554E48|nr:viperin family antiviral radical SAM protein [Treponema primitia]
MGNKASIINLHLLDACNYRCGHCFAHFNMPKVLPLEQWKRVIDNIIANSDVKRFNLAGGEPLLYPEIDNLIRYIASKHIETSIITNGLLLNENRINFFSGMVSMVGISIDSLNDETLRRIGRCTYKDELLNHSHCVSICKSIKTHDIKLKINTLVSTLNKNEDFHSFIKEVQPDRWKILKMKHFENAQYNNKIFIPNNYDYESFVARHSDMPLIAEREMKNAYIMVDAWGNLVDTGTENNAIVASLLEIDFAESFSRLNFNYDVYNQRYVA